MGRTFGIALAAACAAACTSVHMVQKDGCWVKQTTHTFGGEQEELGFCARTLQKPAEDRMSRLVQECMAQADYRWENRAISAWNHGQAIPPQQDDEKIAQICMEQASAALAMEAKNKALQERVADLAKDRDALHATAESDRQFLQRNSEQMVAALGEAAKRPAPSATATATSQGTAKTDATGQPPTTVVTAPAPMPTTVIVPQGAIAPVVLPRAPARTREPKAKVEAKVEACVPPPQKPALRKADEKTGEKAAPVKPVLRKVDDRAPACPVPAKVGPELSAIPPRAG